MWLNYRLQLILNQIAELRVNFIDEETLEAINGLLERKKVDRFDRTAKVAFTAQIRAHAYLLSTGEKMILAVSVCFFLNSTSILKKR